MATLEEFNAAAEAIKAVKEVRRSRRRSLAPTRRRDATRRRDD
jgi:hypothetical protein